MSAAEQFASRPLTIVTQSETNAVCDVCESVVHQLDGFCTDCGQPRPRTGWMDLGSVDDPWLGRVVDERWFPSRRVGSGSTATVYRVEALSMPRRFALKIVNLDQGVHLTRDETLERARTEVATVGSLHNPHIVAIYDLVTLSPTHVAMLMEYVEGPTLRDIVDEHGPLPPRRALELVRQLANGLYEAHEHGIVHCDVKPDNLLIETLPSGEDFLHITDFGIARIAKQDTTKGFVGTPLWAAPEQVLGQPLDHRADIYSIGALLFYLLTGEPPFSDPSFVKVLKAHVSSPPPWLNDATDAVFSAPLNRLVDHLLKKDPDHRPSDLRGLVRKLDALERVDDWDVVRRTNPAMTLAYEDGGTVDLSPVQPRGPVMQHFELPGVRAAGSHASMSASRIVAEHGGDVYVTTLVPRRTFRQHPRCAPITAVAATDRYTLVGCADGTVGALEADGEFHVVCQLGASVSAIASDPAGNLALAAGTDGTLYVARKGEWRAVGIGAAANCLAVDDRGHTVAVARPHGVEVFDGHALQRPRTCLPILDARGLALSQDGHLLAVMHDDSTVSVWGVETRRPIFAATRSRGRLMAIHFAADALLGLAVEGDEAYIVDLQQRHGDEDELEWMAE